MNERKRITQLNQSKLTQGCKRRDIKNNKNDEVYMYFANGSYHPNSRYVKKTSKLFEEKIKKDLERNGINMTLNKEDLK